jgi:hypothetical protein
MPIYEYSCVNCRNKVEKITQRLVKETTVPQQIIQKCVGRKCAGAVTRHIRQVSAPAYVGLTPPATSQKATRMSQMREAKDKNWKQRVKKGLNPEGKKLTNRKKENRKEWEATVETAFPDLKEKQREVVGRVKAGEFKVLTDATKKMS